MAQPPIPFTCTDNESHVGRIGHAARTSTEAKIRTTPPETRMPLSGSISGDRSRLKCRALSHSQSHAPALVEKRPTKCSIVRTSAVTGTPSSSLLACPSSRKRLDCPALATKVFSNTSLGVRCLSTELTWMVVTRRFASPTPSALRVSHSLSGLIPSEPRGFISRHIRP